MRTDTPPNQREWLDLFGVAWCRIVHCFSDLLQPPADHPEMLTFSYARCDAAPPVSFPLGRMSMKDSLFPPPPVFAPSKLKRLLFMPCAVHLKCPVAEHIHSRRSEVFAFDSWNAVLDFLAPLSYTKCANHKSIYFPALQTWRIRVAFCGCVSHPYRALWNKKKYFRFICCNSSSFDYLNLICNKIEVLK